MKLSILLLCTALGAMAVPHGGRIARDTPSISDSVSASPTSQQHQRQRFTEQQQRNPFQHPRVLRSTDGVAEKSLPVKGDGVVGCGGKNFMIESSCTNTNQTKQLGSMVGA
ncbi:hypothetical protein N8T08_010127 [Aspergillus melleus]|uniref:Uncharacterized protein n=1 Tax=Aspergillus melleus TaxID=138277 RepID=A0ACC3BCW2_9EURO|nr:hypothetical protein N8T08_010127 [Aspergillus melleus]